MKSWLLLFLFNSLTAFGQVTIDSVKAKIDRDLYLEFAQKSFSESYERTVEYLENELSNFTYNTKDSLIDANPKKFKFLEYKREDFTIKSIPRFSLNDVFDKQNFKPSLLDFIGFDSSNLSQEVLVYANDSLFSEFRASRSLDTIFKKEDEFYPILKILYFSDFYKGEFPIYVGGTSNDYFPEIELRSEMFAFRLNELSGLFIIKNNNLYYVRRELNGIYNAVGDSELSMFDISRKGTPVWHIVDEKFLMKIKKEYLMKSKWTKKKRRLLKKYLKS